HEVLDDKGDTVYVPGNSVPTFPAEGKLDGLTYGVEICLDHAFGSLKTRRPNGVTPDVVVLMSAKVKLDHAKLPNPYTMMIHACSYKDWNFVGRGGVRASRVSPDQTTDYTVYSFDLD